MGLATEVENVSAVDASLEEVKPAVCALWTGKKCLVLLRRDFASGSASLSFVC